MFKKKNWYKRNFSKGTNQDAIFVVALGMLGFQALGKITEMASDGITLLFSKIKVKQQ